jgi:hypothetical protein
MILPKLTTGRRMSLGLHRIAARGCISARALMVVSAKEI